MKLLACDNHEKVLRWQTKKDVWVAFRHQQLDWEKTASIIRAFFLRFLQSSRSHVGCLLHLLLIDLFSAAPLKRFRLLGDTGTATSTIVKEEIEYYFSFSGRRRRNKREESSGSLMTDSRLMKIYRAPKKNKGELSPPQIKHSFSKVGRRRANQYLTHFIHLARISLKFWKFESRVGRLVDEKLYRESKMADHLIWKKKSILKVVILF